MTSHIRLLHPELISKIAAGEVVERPASVVKELVENSIDSGADEIKIYIERGGINYIEVQDNGSGMDKEDAKLSLVQHATSKIQNIKDLTNILTLGFRGEALASISSIAETIIYTKSDSSVPIQVSKKDDRIELTEATARSKGTSIIVKNIFQKIPARKKFLRSESTEYKYILNLFIKIALINFNISFELHHNHRKVYTLHRRNTWKERIKDIYPNLDGFLIPVSFEEKKIILEGFIGHPSLNRSDNSLQFIFVNKRPINDSFIIKAAKVGFGTNLMQHQSPVFFINLQIDPEIVDVNVHPRKTEVRFDNPREIFQIITKTFRNSLEKTLREELKVRFNSNQGDNVMAPNLLTDSKVYKGISTATKTHKSSDMGLDFTRNLLQPILAHESSQHEEYDTLDFQVIQIMKTYILTESKNELLIIDQHAAAERISYERIMSDFEKKTNLPNQELLLPESIFLSEEDKIKLNSSSKELRRIGFEFSIQDNYFKITAVPEILANKNFTQALQEILETIKDYSTKEETPIVWKFMATLACHGSIRAGEKISTEQAKHLVNNLLKCKQPYSCPHGRPIIWALSKNELEKKFKRKV